MAYFLILTTLLIQPQDKPQEEIVVQEPSFIKDPQELSKEHSYLYLVPQRPISPRPFRVGYNNNLNSLFGFTLMEDARTIDEGNWSTIHSIEASTISLRESTQRFFFNYKVTLLEYTASIKYGLDEGWEGFINLSGGQLYENSGDAVLVRDGKTVIQPGNRTLNLGDLTFGVKKFLMNVGQDGILSATAAIRLPATTDHDDLVTSIGVDTNYGLLYTHIMGTLTVHANLGLLVPGEADVFDQPVDLTTPLYLGVAAIMKISDNISLLGQLQGNQSVFNGKTGSIEILDGITGTFTSGLRARVGSYNLELGIGTGLTDVSSKLLWSLAFEIKF